MNKNKERAKKKPYGESMRKCYVVTPREQIIEFRSKHDYICCAVALRQRARERKRNHLMF